MSIPLNSDVKMVVLGRIGAPFGVQGWVHAQSFTDPQEKLFNYSDLYLSNREHWEPVKIQFFRSQGKNWVLKLAGSDNRELAKELTHRMLGVPRTSLPPLPAGEFYWH